MTTNQPNPEAVEAAARAILAREVGIVNGTDPGDTHDLARAALSAALPLLPDVGDLLAELDRLRAAKDYFSGRTEAQVKAEALREAARAVGHAPDCPMDPDRDPYMGCRCRMSLLYARAARIERGEV